MGNCELHERNREVAGSMELGLDKIRITRGSSLTGRLVLYLRKEYPGRQLSIRVRGIESIKKGKAEFAENEIFGDTILLVSVGILKTGEHKFFFDYKFPSNIIAQCSTSLISQQPKYAVSMVYQVKAILEPVELVIDEFQRIEQSAYFSFLEDVPKSVLSSTSSGKLFNEIGDYGRVKITLKSDKSAYDSGDKVRLEVCMNNTEVLIPLEYLRYNLVRETHFIGKAKNAFFQSIRHDFSKEPERVMLIQEEIKFQRGELDHAASSFIEFELPQNLLPSFSGKQYTCKYFFELYAHYVKGPTNFIDAKSKLKINIIPEKMRNYINVVNSQAQLRKSQSQNVLSSAAAQRNSVSAQLQHNSRKSIGYNMENQQDISDLQYQTVDVNQPEQLSSQYSPSPIKNMNSSQHQYEVQSCEEVRDLPSVIPEPQHISVKQFVHQAQQGQSPAQESQLSGFSPQRPNGSQFVVDQQNYAAASSTSASISQSINQKQISKDTPLYI